MLELILKIREHTEAGSILEHMYLFDELQSIKFVGMYCGVNAWALDVDDDILVDEVESKVCDHCNGSGYVIGFFREQEPCIKCKNKGFIHA